MAAVRLAAGESTSVAVHVPRAELAYWDRDAAGPAGQSGDWVVEGGEYRIDIGHSSRDIVATTTATVAADPSTKTAGLASTLSELLADKATRPIVLGALEKSMGITELDPTLEKLIGSIPLGRIAPMLGLNAPELEGVLAKA